MTAKTRVQDVRGEAHTNNIDRLNVFRKPPSIGNARSTAVLERAHTEGVTARRHAILLAQSRERNGCIFRLIDSPWRRVDVPRETRMIFRTEIKEANLHNYVRGNGQ